MWSAWTITHTNANVSIFVWVKVNNAIYAANSGRNGPLHPGVIYDRVEVAWECVTIQYESNNDVGTGTSIRLPVNGHSRSLFCVVDCSRLALLELFQQVFGKNQRRHFTQQPVSVCVSFRQLARLQNSGIYCTKASWSSYNVTFTTLSLPLCPRWNCNTFKPMGATCTYG